MNESSKLNKALKTSIYIGSNGKIKFTEDNLQVIYKLLDYLEGKDKSEIDKILKNITNNNTSEIDKILKNKNNTQKIVFAIIATIVFSLIIIHCIFAYQENDSKNQESTKE